MKTGESLGDFAQLACHMQQVNKRDPVSNKMEKESLCPRLYSDLHMCTVAYM